MFVLKIRVNRDSEWRVIWGKKTVFSLKVEDNRACCLYVSENDPDKSANLIMQEIKIFNFY